MNKPTKPPESAIQALHCESTSHSLAPGAKKFLAAHGYSTADSALAYGVLAAFAAHEDTDRTGQSVLEKLKAAISDPHSSQPWHRKQEIWRLIRRLQVKRKLHTLRTKSGAVLPDADSIAKEMHSLWSSTMVSLGLPSVQVSAYSCSFFNGKLLAGMAKLLIKPLPQSCPSGS